MVLSPFRHPAELTACIIKGDETVNFQKNRLIPFPKCSCFFGKSGAKIKISGNIMN